MRQILLGLLALCGMCEMAWSLPFCTARDLRGTYALQADGSVLVPNTPITGPFMRQGWFILDGVGNVTASSLAVYNGINFGDENYGGTYTVTTDCQIEFHLFVPAPVNANADFKGRIANDGEDIMFMLTSTDSPQAPAITTVLGHGRKRKLRTCSLGDTNGNYRIEVHGWLNLPPIGTGTPVRVLGRIETDGAGALSASFVESIGGNIAEEATNGSYVVQPDCTFSLSFMLGGSPMIIRGSLIGLGREAFVALNPPGIAVPDVGIINGVVATGTMIQQSVSNADR